MFIETAPYIETPSD